MRHPQPPPLPASPFAPPGLRDDYETSPLPLAKLAAHYGITTTDITRFRLTEGWTARPNNIAAIKTFRMAGALDRLTSAIGASAPASHPIPSAPSPDGTPEAPSVVDGAIRDPEHCPTKWLPGSAQKMRPNRDTDEGRCPSTPPRGDPLEPESRAQPWSGEREAAERPSHVARRAARRRKSSGSPAHRRSLIARLHDLVDQKIAEIEKRLASADKVTAADSERESKAIGFFIKQLEQLKEVADAEARTQRAADSPAVAADPDARFEAERLRADLVERIDRLRRSRADAAPAG